MEAQNQIKRRLSLPDAIKRIRNLLNDAANGIKRTALADKLCEQIGFFNPRGNKQRAGCLKALRELEKTGLFILPQAFNIPGKRSPRRLTSPVPEPVGVPEEAGEIRGLRLVIVDTEEQILMWNELMIQDHPRGAGLLSITVHGKTPGVNAKVRTGLGKADCPGSQGGLRKRG